MTGTNTTIVQNIALIRLRHWTYRAGLDGDRRNYWVDANKRKRQYYRNKFPADAFALVIATVNGGDDDAYVIPYKRLSQLFDRSAPEKKGAWVAHIVHDYFYFKKEDCLNVTDCHASQPRVKDLIQATLDRDEESTRSLLLDLGHGG